MTGEMTSDSLIRSLRVVFVPEPKNTIEEEDGPTDEQRDHEPMDDVDHVIDLSTMGGKILGDTEELRWT